MDGKVNPIIIFDTATRLVYCEDVHQMLASLGGTTVTYDYRERWVEPGCIPSLREGAPVILVYCELPGFDRKVDAKFYWGSSVVPIPGARFTTTRAAIITAVRVDGGVYHIDLKLDGYVSVPSPLLEDRIEALPSRPGQHFVVQSVESWDFAWLLRSGKRVSWAAVVDKLQSVDLQFARDIFWRIEALVDGRSGRALRADAHGKFLVRTGRTARILIASHTGKDAAAELAWDARRVKVDSVSNSPLLVIKSRADISVRRAGEAVIEIEFPVTSEWRKKTEMLLVRTEIEGALGSVVTLNFEISHHPLRVLVAVVLFLSASLGAVAATGLIRADQWGDGLLAAAFGFAAGLLGNKVLPFKS